jgi:uncharacterized NAD-dependent epimerase/dehydratase family protein
LENVLIENGLKDSLSLLSQIYFSVHCHKPSSPSCCTPPLPLNDVAEELEIIETKEMRKVVQVATNKTSRAKRKTGCKIDNAECDGF